jgi:hypothetical protein
MVLEKSELGVILKKEMKRKIKRKRERISKRESGDLRGCVCFFLIHDDGFVVFLSRLKAAFFIVSSLSFFLSVFSSFCFCFNVGTWKRHLPMNVWQSAR